MERWHTWYMIAASLRHAFSRRQTFLWFLTALAGLLDAI